MIKVLNLHHRELIADRSAMIKELDGELYQGASRHDLIIGFFNEFRRGTRVSFANAAIQ